MSQNLDKKCVKLWCHSQTKKYCHIWYKKVFNPLSEIKDLLWSFCETLTTFSFENFNQHDQKN